MSDQVVTWRRSSRCEATCCVEVAVTADVVLVRDSGDVRAPAVGVDHRAWQAFCAAVKAGDFDR